jgi:diguanylate cyclase (GGDEF)-like protein
MVMPQLLFGITAVGIGYSLLESMRGATLVLLSLALVFDMHRLTPRQIVIATVGSILVLGASLLLTWRYSPGRVDIRAEAPNVLFACALLPALCIISLQVTALRKRLINQKADLEAAVTKLKHLSEHDGLTGLYNRRHAQTSMDQNKCQGPPSCECCVVILDIDHFKHINDTFGHSIGDAVLRNISSLLRECMRGPDIVARWGGEEFLLFLPKMSGQQSVSALQRFRKKVMEFNWGSIAPQLSVSFSAGVAECSNTERWMRTLHRADTALYEAKRTGRDRIILV